MRRSDASVAASLRAGRLIMSACDILQPVVASKTLFAALMLVAAWGLVCPFAGTIVRAQAGKTVASPEARARIRKAISAVGLVLVRNADDPPERRPRPRGSAVVVRPDGVVVTTHHVTPRDTSDRLYDEIYFR